MAVNVRSGASRGHAPATDASYPSSEARLRPHTTPMPNWPWNLPVTARTVQGMAPYPGQARCLALGFWPECFRRLDVKGGRRPFPKETRSALDIEGNHVTIQRPSTDPSPAMTFCPKPPAGAGWCQSWHGPVYRDGVAVCGHCAGQPKRSGIVLRNHSRGDIQVVRCTSM